MISVGVVVHDVTGLAVGPSTSECERFAAILDWENIAITRGGRLSPTEMRVHLDVIEAHVSGMPVRVATGINVLSAHMGLIDLQRWGLTLVPTEPDAADIALCESARDFVRCGVTDIVVVGGDHAYVSLAAHARLHVVSHADHLSKSLRLAAATVTHLPDLHSSVRTAGWESHTRFKEGSS